MGDQYCQYCHKQWKYKKEYEKHLACCAYFYNLRRNPRPEMDDYGCALPTQKEMFRFIQELSLKCERLEKEVGRLKNTVGVRKKKVITDCLNRPGQTPPTEFNEWWRKLSMYMPVEATPEEETDMDAHWSIVNNVFLFRVFKRNLVEGIKHVLQKFVESELLNGKLPVRCFVQKPGIFYIYCGGIWRHMTNDDFETMIDYISQLFVREFLAWQRENAGTVDEDERRLEEQIRYMTNVNRMYPSKEKGMTEIRKWLFVKLEENASTTLETEFV